MGFKSPFSSVDLPRMLRADLQHTRRLIADAWTRRNLYRVDAFLHNWCRDNLRGMVRHARGIVQDLELCNHFSEKVKLP